MLLTIYLIFSLVVLITLVTVDSFEEVVTIGDIFVYIGISLIPVLNIGIFISLIEYIFIKYISNWFKKILEKPVFKRNKSDN